MNTHHWTHNNSSYINKHTSSSSSSSQHSVHNNTIIATLHFPVTITIITSNRHSQHNCNNSNHLYSCSNSNHSRNSSKTISIHHLIRQVRCNQVRVYSLINSSNHHLNRCFTRPQPPTHLANKNNMNNSSSSNCSTVRISPSKMPHKCQYLLLISSISSHKLSSLCKDQVYNWEKMWHTARPNS